MNNDSWRPTSLREFIGQRGLMNLLEDEVDAAIAENRPLPHCVFYGPPGLGKTTLVDCVAAARRVRSITVMGRTLSDEMLTETLCTLPSNGYDIAGRLVDRNQIQPQILTIDEAEVVPRKTWESLHTILEPDGSGRRIFDGKVPGISAKQKVWVPEVTVILLTNFYGELKKVAEAAVNRCSIKWQFETYTEDELVQMVQQYSMQVKQPIEPAAAVKIAQRATGVPRTAIDLFKRARTRLVAQRARGELVTEMITPEIVDESSNLLRIDANGLTQQHRDYLNALSQSPGGKMAIQSIAAVLNVNAQTLSVDVEPYLMRKGYVAVVPGGRQITPAGLATVTGKKSPALSRII